MQNAFLHLRVHHTFLSDSRQSDETEMIRIGMMGALLAAVTVVHASAQAQPSGFAIFEHRPTPNEVADPDPTDLVQAERKPSLSAPAPAPTFREAIYSASVREAELRYSLPSGLLQALIWTESRFNPMAISPAGAAGLAQLMPGTARYLGVVNRHDPRASIDGGARYLREMLNKFGAIHLALAAYNAGPGAVERAGGIPRNSETPGYVRSVLDRWQAISSRI